MHLPESSHLAQIGTVELHAKMAEFSDESEIYSTTRD